MRLYYHKQYKSDLIKKENLGKILTNKLSRTRVDTLQIKNLKANTRIGVYAWEQHINQQLLIDISIDTDLSSCQEDLNKTIDYAALCETVTHFVESKAFQLLETVANEVAQFIQENFKVAQLTVGVSKPHAIKNADNIQVIVRR
jgi:dihydroneopterin aldolase